MDMERVLAAARLEREAERLADALRVAEAQARIAGDTERATRLDHCRRRNYSRIERRSDRYYVLLHEVTS